MADDLPWLSLTAAAEMSGLARETVRARARRGLIPSRKGNDGKVVVQLPAAEMSDSVHGQSADISTHAQLPPADMVSLHAEISDLLAEVSDLRETLARAMSERDAAKSVGVSVVAAKDELIAELKMMLAEARKPWWRRWFG